MFPQNIYQAFFVTHDLPKPRLGEPPVAVVQFIPFLSRTKTPIHYLAANATQAFQCLRRDYPTLSHSLAVAPVTGV